MPMTKLSRWCTRTQFIPVGVYTSVEVKSGKGSTVGWISPGYTVRI
ncbi:hypothetical protein [Ruminococcus sp. NK3A76]|nr:hypothetical protein [Ruminococcus sp. NK3A76]